MLGVEVVRPSLERRRGHQDGQLATAIKLAAFDNGLLIETGGRHGAVLRLLPPLILTEVDVGTILDRLDVSISQAKRHTARG
jgi:diaminobutyrate-2-oxoglutarate transaminase